MAVDSVLPDPARVDEPDAVQGFADVLTQVASEGKTMIVRRNGKDLAAVISIPQLNQLREMVARQQAEQLAASIQWGKNLPPPQAWFDDTDNPFESEHSSP